jgi:DNA-directed RNA polymerase subunit RPC12/RpoP
MTRSDDTREMLCFNCHEEQVFEQYQGLREFKCTDCGTIRVLNFG